ncbi:MAG TPA: hypothetical protein VK599_06205 [Streptosporangiaceae bacterium]|jgi:Flp pilus assembly protein TadB|nr:hypothetical protein [Streptosporangiaceae bacterium]
MRDDQSPLDRVGRGRQPWFGRKRIGVGWSPRTWPGALVTSALLVAIVAGLAGTRAGWAVYLVAAIPLVVLAIRTAARRAAARRRG